MRFSAIEPGRGPRQVGRWRPARLIPQERNQPRPHRRGGGSQPPTGFRFISTPADFNKICGPGNAYGVSSTLRAVCAQ